jgi:hypothetical protein
MYSSVLLLHSWVRWVALVAGVGATIAAFSEAPGRGSGRSAPWGLALVTALDVQLLLGLLLYFVVSPNMAVIREHFGEAMKTASLRFWAVEHVTLMLAAVVLAHVGRVLMRKTPKRTAVAILFAAATVAMFAGMPWPGMAYGRPLFRF